MPLSPLSTWIHADLEVEVIFALAFPCILYWLPNFLPALRRDTHLEDTIDTTTSNADHQANGTPDDFDFNFAFDHHPVFLVHSPHYKSEHHCFLYVEGNLDSKEEKKEEETFLKLSKELAGHKFWVGRRATGEGVQDTPCSHPFHSNKRSRMRPSAGFGVKLLPPGSKQSGKESLGVETTAATYGPDPPSPRSLLPKCSFRCASRTIRLTATDQTPR